ncbi:MAG: hypothetical protein EBS34_13020 [Flavobacteriales bacterium]|nr:hypothetical protein [Flavobacteriales bacterium]
MATKYTRGYLQFIREAEEAERSAPLKGYPADQIITRIGELMEVLSDQVRFGVPSDNLGRATTYRDANGAIQRIKDILHYYESKNEQVRFYCWSLSYGGTWKAAKNLRQKIEDAGGFGEELNNVNLKKVIEYFENNPEDSDNLRSLSISIDSESIRKAMATPQPKEKPEASPQTEEPTQN